MYINYSILQLIGVTCAHLILSVLLSIFIDGYLIYLFICFYFLTNYFSALGQAKQTTFMSPLGFILPSDPGRIIVKQARKKSKNTVLFYLA